MQVLAHHALAHSLSLSTIVVASLLLMIVIFAALLIWGNKDEN